MSQDYDTTDRDRALKTAILNKARAKGYAIACSKGYAAAYASAYAEEYATGYVKGIDEALDIFDRRDEFPNEPLEDTAKAVGCSVEDVDRIVNRKRRTWINADN